MKWQPIETYDNLKKKPRFAVFYVQAKIVPERSYASLFDSVVTERRYGSRIVTHWMPLPDPPKP